VSNDKTNETDGKLAGRGWNLFDLTVLKRPPETLAALVYTALILLITTLIAFSLILTFRFAYDSWTGDIKDRVEAAKVFFPVVVALIGGPILVWRALTSHWAAQAARHQAETGREAHFTSLFTKAVEQLGATRDTIKRSYISPNNGTAAPQTLTETEPNLEVRLGAIYAFERVARDSDRDYWPIMEVLCAYVRNPHNCGLPITRPTNAFPMNILSTATARPYREWVDSIPRPRVDIQAILAVLARQQSEHDERGRSRGNRLDFSNANLQRANFYGGFFAKAGFIGTHLDKAFFHEADLRGSQFMTAHLEEVDMVRARLDDCWFGSALMDCARLHQATCDRTTFDEAHLDYATFNGGRLTNTDFGGAHLRGARFHGAVLKDVDFIGAFATGASFLGAVLQNVGGVAGILGGILVSSDCAGDGTQKKPPPARCTERRPGTEVYCFPSASEVAPIVSVQMVTRAQGQASSPALAPLRRGCSACNIGENRCQPMEMKIDGQTFQRSSTAPSGVTNFSMWSAHRVSSSSFSFNGVPCE
jgi:uncharacterized protein YjbI with pentapeptide repeats